MSFTWHASENQRFWQANQSTYQSTFNALPLLTLCDSYVGETILDAGAGDGSLLHAIRTQNANIDAIGIDLAPKHADVLYGNIANMSFPNESFDTIFSTEVLEHLSPVDTSRALMQMERVLKPGGHLILTTPFNEVLSENQVSCPHCQQQFHRWGHQQSFNVLDFQSLARVYDLEPLEVMPVRFSRVRRLQFLGGRILRSQLLRYWICTRKGRCNLILIARKTASHVRSTRTVPQQVTQRCAASELNGQPIPQTPADV